MNNLEKVKNWEVPTWHKDYGDPKREIFLLKELCLFVLNLGLNYNFEIEFIEEGYLRVNIFKSKKYYGEFQVVDNEKYKIGLFLKNGNEFYIYNKEEIKKYL